MITPADLTVQAAAAGFDYDVVKNETSAAAGDGTPIEAQIVNNIWYALLAVLDEAGITPDGSIEDSTASQFLEAIQTLISGLLADDDTLGGATPSDLYAPTQANVKTYADGQSLQTAGGYQVLPSGIMIQWGITDAYSGAEVEVPFTFHTAFTNGVFTVTPTLDYPAVIGGAIGVYVKTGSLTAAGGTFISDSSSAALTNAKIRWVAIGN